MANPLDVLFKFVFDNIFIIAIIGILGYFAWEFLRIRRKAFTRPINRSEIERMKFIERMKYNIDKNKLWFFRGKARIGKITHLKQSVLKMNPDNFNITEIIVKPNLIWKITNPFSKSRAFTINEETIVSDGKKVIIPVWNAFDYYFGVYYDLSIPKEHMQIIKNDNLIRTDLNELASVYYCKSQEQSTFDPIRAHQLALEEKKLEIELAKARGKAETV